MSHLDTIETFWTSIENNDLEALRNVLTPDIEFVEPSFAVSDIDTVISMIGAFTHAMPDLGHRTIRGFETGNEAVVEINITGTNTGGMASADGTIPPTGLRLDVRSCDVVSFTGPRISSYRVYTDTTHQAAVFGAGVDASAFPTAVALANRIGASILGNDIDAYCDCYSSNAVLTHPLLGVVHGRKAIAAAEAALFTAFRATRFDIRNVAVSPGGWASIEVETLAMHVGTLTLPDGTDVAATGNELTLPMSTVVRIDEQGRVAEERRYFDPQVVLASLGLASQPVPA